MNISNTANSAAAKGSKFWMQKIVNEKFFTIQVEEILAEKNLVWISPLESESYKEYQLKEQKIFSNVLGLTKDEFRKKFSFWASNQPHWDAIATSADGKILYLFEAKAHLKELESKIRAGDKSSIEKITRSMFEVFKEISALDESKFFLWKEKYYQLGNRLTFLQKMNQTHFPKIQKTALVLLNIVNDETYIATSKEDWARHYEKVFEEMTGKNFPPPSTKIIYVFGNLTNQ